MSPTAVDLFCGAGGASLGLVPAGWDLRLATDIDPACSMTHQANLPGSFITEDLRELAAGKVLNEAGLSPGELDLLFAGPPCQGFSMIGSRVVWDKRNNLFREVLRLASAWRPACVVIENVPGLVTLAGGAYLRAILEGLSQAGYEAACGELLAAQYGAPQMRWRLIIIGWRKDLGIPAGYGFPRPTVGAARIGDLLPNCTIPSWQLDGFVTTAEAIGDLPPVTAGEEATHYEGPPEGPYQQAMRAGLNGELSNHYAARLSAANLARLAIIKPGQGDGLDAAAIVSDLKSFARDEEKFRRGVAEYTEYLDSYPKQERPKRQPLELIPWLQTKMQNQATQLDRDTAATITNVSSSASLRQAVQNTQLQRVILFVSILAIVVAIISLVIAAH